MIRHKYNETERENEERGRYGERSFRLGEQIIKHERERERETETFCGETEG